MGNIIGSPFESFVKNQVDIRQTALGQYSNIDANSLKYYSAKTPWLRLASSVNLTDIAGDDDVYSRLRNYGFEKNDIINDNLAKNFVLYGGAVSLQDEKSLGDTISSFKGLNSGLTDGNVFNGAYGWGGIRERGYVPMPGITSAQTTYYNNGALSKATVNIKCYSKEQFSLLDVLYLRPGYTLLLEFGWSGYLTPTGFQTFQTYTSTPLQYLLNPSAFPKPLGKRGMYERIKTERELYQGNYEAIYGKITNFKWSFSKDGSYDISVDIVGMGDILESLKLNIIDPNNNNQSNTQKELVEYELTYDQFGFKQWGKNLWNTISDEYFQDPNYASSAKTFGDSQTKELQRRSNNRFNRNSKKEDIKAWTKTRYDALVEEAQNQSDLQASSDNNDPILANKTKTKLNKDFYSVYQTFSNINKSEIKKFYYGVPQGAMCITKTFKGDVDISGDDKRYKSIYIKFSVLLQMIEKNCNLFLEDGEKMIEFDFAYSNEFDDNYMLIMPPNLSANPNKCIVPFTKASIEDVVDYKSFDLPTDGNLNKLLTNTNFLVNNNPFIGRLGNVMINLSFAADTLANSNKDEDGAISVLTYIKTILQGINESLGSINNFTVTYDEVDGVIKIYDESPKPGLEDSNDSAFTTLNIFGVKRGLESNEGIQNSFSQQNVTGSFITNIGLDAQIPNNFAAQVSIGSQVSGNNLQGNATSFSNYNKGLIDRILPEKNDWTKKEDKDTTPKKNALKIFQQKIYYKDAIDKNKTSPFSAIYRFKGKTQGGGRPCFDFTADTLDSFLENYTSYIKLIQGKASENKKVPAPFFLPFNLNLEMDGLAGMRLFQKFRITDDILPPSYEKDSIDIIVKGINHSITTKAWTTTIDTLSVPRIPIETPLPVEKEETENDKQKQLEDVAEGERGPRVDPTLLIVSAAGINEIKRSEAFRANSYYDSVGVLTIGYGTTEMSFNDPYEWDDLIYDEQPITEAKATALLRMHIRDNVQGFIYNKIKVDLTQNEFDALVSFIYNVGSGNFNNSTLVKKLNQSDYDGAADEFLRWDKAGGEVLAGLTKRREQERELFLT
tara:strand:+ start:6234 stop:9425 length:3192 start_codon:yes stop_codon:yes gene_type:complete